MTRRRTQVKLRTSPPLTRLTRREATKRELFCEVCMQHGVPLTRLEGRTVCVDRASCESIAPPLFTREEAEYG